MKLENKTIIVTGSGRGIGKYIAKRLGKEGATIVVTGRNEAEIEKVCDEINDDGGRAIFIKGDVTSEEDVREVINKTIQKFGKIDVLVNNAGVGLRKLLWETKVEEFEEIMDVNVKGVFLYMKNIIPKMKGGLIINISSGAGKAGISTLSVYCASKFAVIGLTEAVSGEVGKNIKIVALCPGSVNTGMFKKMFPGEKADLEPEEVAEKVADICIHPGKYRSGESIEIY
ncbi:MAG: SDR family NAD(P)-dependent oxidoreductase [Candidatus Methanoperedens sp.]|nr:SDR family NAD(P)-dependent oxidoreductase [Candidatus Methanoperedens sp.]MCZ7404927.1 SDR family NAD(P)-dependent oxidoreductase [Candidatus Methanoperedens sp.]